MIDVLLIAITIWVILAIIGAIALVGIACHRAWTRLRDSWQRASAVIEQTQDELGDVTHGSINADQPYWPAGEPDERMISRLATLVFCPLCHPGGHGRCICVAYCGDKRCTYDHTTVSMLTAADQAWLRQHGVTEETDQ